MPLILNAHQRASIQAMITRERECRVQVQPGRMIHTRLGINGNDAGSGKTRAMLALIHTDTINPHLNLEPYTYTVSRGLLAHEEYTPTFETCPTTIILANGSIRHQWIRELQTADCLRFVLLDNVRKLEAFVPTEIDVAIVNTSVYKRLVTMNKLWHRFIYDETDSNIFPGMDLLCARFTWFVTATWTMLERFTHDRRGRTWLRHALRRSLYGVTLESLVIYNQRVSTLPPIEEHTHPYRSGVSIVQAVAHHIEPAILLQIEAGDVTGAIQSLGGDSTTTNIVELIRTRLERALEEARLRVQLNRGNVIHWEERVQQLQIDLGLVYERFQSILSDENCSICMSPFSNPVLAPCHHVFCFQCIVPWFNHQQSCPQCRTALQPHQLMRLSSTSETSPPAQSTSEDKETDVSTPIVDHRLPTRMEILTRLVVTQWSPEKRILIFSEHDTSLHNIQSILGGLPYAMLSGHGTTRARILDQYKDGQIPILLLNSRMNGAGIDLPETTDVILFHTMHQSLEDQSIGRGHRLGRTVPLRVHRFVVS
jgi:hypothetical protein